MSCEFDKDGICTALACYSREKCSARDSEGNPAYGDVAKEPNAE